MKKVLIIVIIAIFCLNIALIADLQKPLYDEKKITRESILPEGKDYSGQILRDNVNPSPPVWEFTHSPETVGPINYYDYMPGSYCSHPLMKQREGLINSIGQPFGPGVYMIYQTQAGPTVTPEINRRIYYGYLDPDDNIWNATVTSVVLRQGFPGMTIHPASGSCIASWHSLPTGTYKTSMVYDDIQLLGIPGFWKSPMYFTQPAADLLYIWPYVFAGPSPTYNTDGSVRIYQVSHADNDNTVEDVLFRYIDVPNDNFVYGELEQILIEGNWSTPERIFTDWHVGPPTWPSNASSRPYDSFAVDWNNPGHVSFMGYAGFHAVDTLTNVPSYVEPGFYVWESFDGGETWDTNNFQSCPFMVSLDPSSTERLNKYALYKVENTAGFTYTDSLAQTFTPDSLFAYAGFPGSSITCHRSALYDHNSNIRLPVQLQYVAFEGDGIDYLSAWSSYEYRWVFQAEIVYKNDGTWEINHVPKMPGNASGYSVPWTVAGADTTWYPWLSMAYSNLSDLGFHENLQNQAVGKDCDWMVQMWTDGTKLLKAEYPDEPYPTPTDMNYLNQPIIHISARGGGIGDGITWSDPIEFSDIYTTPFEDQITVYPYLAPYIHDLGDGWGEIYILYFDDNDYGSFIQNLGPNTGGYITYTSIKIDFGAQSVNPEQTNPVFLINYPNPFTTSTTISFSHSKPVVDASVNIYNIKGQLVKTLEINSTEKPTVGYANWDGKDSAGHDVANGIYFYKVNVDDSEYINKMILTR